MADQNINEQNTNNDITDSSFMNETGDGDKAGKRKRNGLLIGLIVVVVLLIIIVITLIIGATRFGFVNKDKIPFLNSGTMAAPTPTREVAYPSENGKDELAENSSNDNVTSPEVTTTQPVSQNVPTGADVQPTQGTNVVIALPTNTPVPTEVPIEKGKHSENLFEWVQKENEKEPAKSLIPEGVTVERTLRNEKEYLTITVGQYTVSYLNDFNTEENPEKYSVVVSNGTDEKTFNWKYELYDYRLSELIPRVYDYCGIGDGREQLAWALTETQGEGNVLHVLSGLNLMEYYAVRPEMAFGKVISDVNFLDVTRCTLMEIKANDRLYYEEVATLSNPEVSWVINPLDYVRYEVGKSKITVKSEVGLRIEPDDGIDGWHIGEIRADVVYNTRDLFVADSPAFYQYVYDDFNDKDHMGIAQPFAGDTGSFAWTPVVSSVGQKLLATAPSPVKLTDKNPEYYEKVDGIMQYKDKLGTKTYLGVDVSHWNTINFATAKKAGLDFAMIRLGYRGTAEDGLVKIDSVYKENIEEALACGLNVGVYFFTQAITVEEAIEEAEFCIKNLKGYKITYPVAFDTESSSNARANNLSNAERTAIARAFCDRIKEAGYTPMIYAGTNWSILNLNMEDLQDIDLWYAYYGEDIYYPYEYTIWQYTESGTFPGVKGNVDINIGFKDYSNVESYK